MGWAKVGLQLWIYEMQSLFLYYYLFFCYMNCKLTFAYPYFLEYMYVFTYICICICICIYMLLFQLWKQFAQICMLTNGLNLHNIPHLLHIYWCYLESHFHSLWHINGNRICFKNLVKNSSWAHILIKTNKSRET